MWFAVVPRFCFCPTGACVPQCPVGCRWFPLRSPEDSERADVPGVEGSEGAGLSVEEIGSRFDAWQGAHTSFVSREEVRAAGEVFEDFLEEIGAFAASGGAVADAATERGALVEVYQALDEDGRSRLRQLFRASRTMSGFGRRSVQ